MAIGRPKGSLNKDKNELVEMLKRECKNYRDPLVILMDGACGEPVNITVYVPAERGPDGRKIEGAEGRYVQQQVYPNLDQQHACAKEVSQYIHAKRKAVEVTGEIDTGAQVHYHLPGASKDMAEWAALTGLDAKADTSE